MEPRDIWTDSRMWALALAQTTIWAGIFYVFPALLLRWHHHFGWSIGEISLGLTLALASSAAVSILAGRIIDRGWSKLLMTVSSMVAALLISVLTQITELWHFYLACALIGITFAGCLYDPCFWYLTKEFKSDAKKAIIMVTVIAGFASTVSYPTYSFISNNYSWETAIYFFSILICTISAPLFWYGISPKNPLPKKSFSRYESQQFQSSSTTNQPIIETVRSLMRNPLFWALFITLASFSINQGMIVSQIFPILESQGVSENMALIFASCIGPMQVIGRLILFVSESTLSKNISMVYVAVLCLSCLAISSLILILGTSGVLTIFVFVVLQGGPNGLASIIKPVLTADLLGRSNFGVVASMAGMGAVWSFALAPAIAGIIADKWNYETVLMMTFTIALIGISSLLLTLKVKDRSPNFNHL